MKFAHFLFSSFILFFQAVKLVLEVFLEIMGIISARLASNCTSWPYQAFYTSQFGLHFHDFGLEQVLFLLECIVLFFEVYDAVSLVWGAHGVPFALTIVGSVITLFPFYNLIACLDGFPSADLRHEVQNTIVGLNFGTHFQFELDI